MKVATKSPARRGQIAATRATLTLSAEAYRSLDRLRGNLPRSTYLQQIIEREKRRREREDFIATANAMCTETFCRESLRLNESLPVDSGA